MATPPLVLVTGASGFVSTWLIKELLEKGEYRVRGTVRDKSKAEKVQPVLDLVPDAKYPIELVEADLNDKDSWGPAVEGCSYVFHVASPFPPPGSPPEDENDCIVPAVNGVINVLTACSLSETVKRVVLTSSTVAIKGYGGIPGRPGDTEYTEDDWMIEEGSDAYIKSKIRAEKAAWDFMEKLGDNKKFDLVSVNPSLIQGPILSAASAQGSAGFSTMLLEKKIPMFNTCIGVIDVRDVAAGEIAAMFSPSAAGKRFILVSDSITGEEFAKLIKQEFEPHGYSVCLFEEPSVPRYKFNTDRMRKELGVNPRPIDQAIIDTCYSMIELGFITKSVGYKGRS